MVATERPKRLVVTADDFGGSPAINQAVIRAHCEGILTSASLMVAGPAAAEAVEMARQNPGLGVGLHLSLVCGRSCLGADRLAGVVDAEGDFSQRPVWAGLRYFFQRRYAGLLEEELAAQFERFRETGLRLDHVNGHLHFHLHPIVLGILLRRREEWGIRGLRLTRDPWWLNLRLDLGRYGYRWCHYVIFRMLGGWAEKRLRACGMVYTDRVFGLLQDGRVHRRYVERLIRRLPPGDSELYAHPSVGEFEHELQALIDPEVKGRVAEERVGLARYQDL